LADHGILKSGIDLLVPQKLLYLLDGHSLVDGPRRQSPPELVRMNPSNMKPLPQTPQADFHAADLQAFMGIQQRNEQSGLIVFPAGKVVLKMDFSPSVKINAAFSVALAEDDTLPAEKIDIVLVQPHQLAHAHSRGAQ